MMSEWRIRDEVLRRNLLPDTRVAVLSLESGATIKSAASSSTGRLTVITSDQDVSLFDTFRGYKVDAFQAEDKVVSAAFSSDDKFIFVVCEASILQIELESRATSGVKFEVHGRVKQAAFNDENIFVLTEDGEVFVYRITAMYKPMSVGLPFVASCFCLDGDSVVVAGSTAFAVVNIDGRVIAAADHNTELHELGALNGVIVGRAKDSVTIWRRHGDQLKQEMMLKDAITKTTYHSSCVFTFNRRDVLAVSFQEQSGRCLLELLDLESLVTVRKWDVSRLGPIAGIAPSARGFVTVLQQGPAIMWTTPKQDKADNWMTCVPNLASCFTNFPYEEAENEFDFNVKRDRSVVSRYKKADKLFDFEPNTASFTADVKMQELTRDQPPVVDCPTQSETTYACFGFSEMSKRWTTSCDEPTGSFDAQTIHF